MNETGQMPFLQHKGHQTVSSLSGVLRHLSRHLSSALHDSALTPLEQAQSVAYKSYIMSKLGDLVVRTLSKPVIRPVKSQDVLELHPVRQYGQLLVVHFQKPLIPSPDSYAILCPCKDQESLSAEAGFYQFMGR